MKKLRPLERFDSKITKVFFRPSGSSLRSSSNLLFANCVNERNAEIEGERTDFKYRTHLWKLGLLRSQWQKHCDGIDNLNNLNNPDCY